MRCAKVSRCDDGSQPWVGTARLWSVCRGTQTQSPKIGFVYIPIVLKSSNTS